MLKVRKEFCESLFSSVQSLSRDRLFATPWIAARQASLSITNCQSLLKLTSIESVMPSNYLILCCPLSSCLQSFPASESFPMSQFFTSGGQSIGASASTLVLPMNIQDWFPLGLTGWISLQSKGLSRVFSNTTVQKHQFLAVQLSLWAIKTWSSELLNLKGEVVGIPELDSQLCRSADHLWTPFVTGFWSEGNLVGLSP